MSGGNRKVIRVADLSDADVAAIKAAKPRRCGAYTRNRGYRFENETRHFFLEGGLDCYRVPYSGAGEEKGDICVTSSWGDRLTFELKRKKALPRWITEPLGEHSGLILRADNGEPLVVVRLSSLRDWLQ